MLFYLIGPAGAGKSKLSQGVAKKNPGYIHLNVDELMESRHFDLFHHAGPRWNKFWTLAKRICADLEEEARRNPDTVYLVDIGAGVLETDNKIKTAQAHRFFASKPQVILVDRGIAESYRHAHDRPGGDWNKKSLKDYKRKEFSPAMKKIFALGQRCNVTGLSEGEAMRKLEGMIKQQIADGG